MTEISDLASGDTVSSVNLSVVIAFTYDYNTLTESLYGVFASVDAAKADITEVLNYALRGQKVSPSLRWEADAGEVSLMVPEAGRNYRLSTYTVRD